MDTRALLIVGIGNPLRRDDGTGWVMARALAAALPSARLLLVQQLAPELAVDLAAPQVAAVCFCDVRQGAPGLMLARLAQDAPEAARLSHEIGPATLLAYTATLTAHPPAAWLLTVGGAEFDHGEGLSEAVQRALVGLPAVAQELAAALAALGSPRLAG